MKSTSHILLLLLTLAAVSCVQQPVYQPPQMSMAEWEASERAVNRIEDQSFAFRHRERMSNAQAIEMATRNNPHTLNQTSTNVIIDN